MRGSNLENIIEGLKSGWKVIVISTIVMTLLASIFTFFIIKPKYEASCKLFIGKQYVKGTTAGNYTNSEVDLYQRLLKTYSEAIRTRTTVEKAIKNAGVEVDPSNVLNSLSVIVVPDTQILELKYASTSAEEAYEVVNALTKEFMKLANELYSNGNVQVIEQPIIPTKASGPNYVVNIMLGAIIGLIIGVGGICLTIFMDTTFRSKDEIEKELGIPVIGIIPEFKITRRG